MRVSLKSVLVPFLLVSCATFSGPGEFRGPVALQSPLSRPSQSLSFGSNPQFIWPVEVARLTRGYQSSPRHHGLDLAAPRGTPIYAAAEGLVIYAASGFSGYGNLIIIEHGGEWATFYSHLDRISVREGQRIRQGDQIGSMGSTGRTTGVHLHFEVRQNRQPVDPLDFLPPSSLATN